MASSQSLKGYPDSAATVCKALLSGTHFRSTGTLKYPTGSIANGGAMRIAPIGLAFRYLTQPAPEGEQRRDLRTVVAETIVASHTHDEAIDGATVIAFLVGRCSLASSPAALGFIEALKDVGGLCVTDEMKKRLSMIADALERQDADPKNKKTREEEEKEDKEMIAQLSSQWFQLKAVDAVAVVVWMFGRYGLRSADEAGGEGTVGEECLIRTIAMGGDTDTIGCMVGAMLGALYGEVWLPVRWLNQMENGEWGRDYVISLAKDLSHLDLTDLGSPLPEAEEKVNRYKESLIESYRKTGGK